MPEHDASADGALKLQLSSDACRLLTLLAEDGTTTRVARRLNKDASVVSRDLSALARAAPVLVKQHGRWQLTDLGRRVTHWFREAALAQQRLLSARPTVRLATTTQFAERVLAPALGTVANLERTTVSVTATAYAELEPLLRAGGTDLVITCGRPSDPLVRYRLAVKEPFVVVAAPRRLRPVPVTAHELAAHPHVQVQAIGAGQLLGLTSELPNVCCHFSEIGPARAACVAGLGWSVLPAYAVIDELERGALELIPFHRLPSEHYGAWWLRDRPDLTDLVDRVVTWLKALNLGVPERSK